MCPQSIGNMDSCEVTAKEFYDEIDECSFSSHPRGRYPVKGDDMHKSSPEAIKTLASTVSLSFDDLPSGSGDGTACKDDEDDEEDSIFDDDEVLEDINLPMIAAQSVALAQILVNDVTGMVYKEFFAPSTTVEKETPSPAEAQLAEDILSVDSFPDEDRYPDDFEVASMDEDRVIHTNRTIHENVDWTCVESSADAIIVQDAANVESFGCEEALELDDQEAGDDETQMTPSTERVTLDQDDLKLVESYPDTVIKQDDENIKSHSIAYGDEVTPMTSSNAIIVQDAGDVKLFEIEEMRDDGDPKTGDEAAHMNPVAEDFSDKAIDNGSKFNDNPTPDDAVLTSTMSAVAPVIQPLAEEMEALQHSKNTEDIVKKEMLSVESDILKDLHRLSSSIGSSNLLSHPSRRLGAKPKFDF